MTEAEREANWPFEDERQQIQTDYSSIEDLIDSLDGSGANTTDLRATTDALACTVTADFGVLGQSSALASAPHPAAALNLTRPLCVHLCDC